LQEMAVFSAMGALSFYIVCLRSAMALCLFAALFPHRSGPA
jgi:hypothetical protein